MPVNVGDLSAGIEFEDRLSAGLDKIHSRLTAAGVDFDQLNTKVLQASDGVAKHAVVQSTLGTALAKAQIEAKTYAKALADAAIEVTKGASNAQVLAPVIKDLGDKYAAAKMQADQLRNATKELANSLNDTAEKAKYSSSQIVAFGRGLQEAGIVATTLLTVPITAAGAAIFHFGTLFETASQKVVALAGASSMEVAKLSSSVLGLAKSVGIGPVELEKGLFVIESAGYRGAAAMDVLTVSAKMSMVGMGDVESTTRAVIGAMLAYKNENLSAAQAGDIFVRTVQLGNMRVEELVGALSRVNPLAAVMGVKFADVNAAIATFTHLGASVDKATTGLVAVLTAIERDGVKTEKGLKAIGISMKDLRAEIEDPGRGLTSALIHLVEAAGKTQGGLDELEKVFPNIRGLTIVLADAALQGKTYANITNEIRNATGDLADSAKVMKETWTQQWNEMVVSVEVLATKIGIDLIPTLKDAASTFKDVVLPTADYATDVFTNLPGPVKDVGIAFLGLAAVAGPGLILTGEMVRSYGHLSKLFEGGLGIAEALPTLAKLNVSIGTITLSSIAMGAALAGAFVFTGMELWSVWTNLVENHRQELHQATEDAEQLAREQAIVALATAKGGVNINNYADAVKYLTEKTKDSIAANLIYGPTLEQLGIDADHITTGSRLSAAAIALLNDKVTNLTPEIVLLAKEAFAHGRSVAEVTKALIAQGLITDEQKISVEALDVTYKTQAKTFKEVKDAMDAVAAAKIPLTAAQKIEATQLLELGLGHKTIADYMRVNVSVINAFVKAKSEEVTALKLETKQLDDSAMRWQEYNDAAVQMSGSSTDKMIAKIEDWKAKQTKAHQDAKTDTADFYDWVERRATQMYAIDGQKLLEADVHSKAHFDRIAREARDAFQFAADHASNFTSKYREELRKTKDVTAEVARHWRDQLGSALDDMAGKVRTLSGEIVSLAEAQKRLSAGGSATYDLSTRTGMEKFKRENPSATINVGIEYFKNHSLQDAVNAGLINLGGHSYKQGGVGNFGTGTLAMLHGEEAIVPLGGSGSRGIAPVTIAAGAFQFNYPIMKDRQSMQELARLIDFAMVNRLRDLGYKG